MVWGLTSRPAGSPAGLPPASRLPTGFAPFARRPPVALRPPSSGCPSPAVLRLPFARRSPVRCLRPLPGSGSPSVSLRNPFHLSSPHRSAAAGRFRRRFVPGGTDQGHQHCRDPARPDRANGPHSRRAAAGHDEMPRQNRLLRAAVSAGHYRARTAQTGGSRVGCYASRPHSVISIKRGCPNRPISRCPWGHAWPVKAGAGAGGSPDPAPRGLGGRGVPHRGGTCGDARTGRGGEGGAEPVGDDRITLVPGAVEGSKVRCPQI